VLRHLVRSEELGTQWLLVDAARRAALGTAQPPRQSGEGKA
jgi:hypothetical protein